jgi:hypothetical protein
MPKKQEDLSKKEDLSKRDHLLNQLLDELAPVDLGSVAGDGKEKGITAGNTCEEYELPMGGYGLGR